MILIPILTRSNPTGLITLVTSLDGLAAQPSQLSFIIRYDEDDNDTPPAIAILCRKFSNILPVCKPRPITLGEAWNQTLARPYPWHIAIPFPDDIVPLCEHWDLIVTQAAAALPAFSWSQTCNPQLPMYPTFTRPYYEACDSQPFPEWFPFWESDRWFWERHELATGTALPIISQLKLGGRHGPTRNMREVDFWFQFYDATRGDRLREATHIRQHLDIATPPNLTSIIHQQERIYQHHMSQAPFYQQSNAPGPLSAPSEQYLLAKSRAIAYLADRPLPSSIPPGATPCQSTPRPMPEPTIPSNPSPKSARP